MRVLTSMHRTQFAELGALFLLQGVAQAIWLVPLSPVLEAHGLSVIRPYAFAASALAAFVSPLIFGAVADRQASPVQVLRGLALATAGTMALATTAIYQGWPPGMVLVLIQLHALATAPAWSLASTIVLARLRDTKHEFGPIRAMATLGWMAGCWLVSALNADASTRAGYSGALVWLIVAGFTYCLSGLPAVQSSSHLTWRERLGLDALTLLRHRDHRVVFLTIALFSIPVAAFYPYSPLHLRDLGFHRTSAWMSLGQVLEVVTMFLLGGLLSRWRLKWILTAGLGCGVLRFAFCALDQKLWLLAGVALHGCSFSFVFVTAQIYLDQRVDAAWRARAQALMSFVTVGVGNLTGYLGTGGWFAWNTTAAGTDWPKFWSGLSLAVVGVLGYFLMAYRGIGKGFRRKPDDVFGA